MTTYPPVVQVYQNNKALDYTHSQIAYVGYEGTIFHLSGPFAPELGAQSGVVMKTIAHLDAPFKHLDNKGARQDGTTWYDSLYDPVEIDMVVHLGGIDEKSTRKVIADWFGAWDPKQLGKLCWFSPERGEWWANVRMNKPVADQFQYDWYQARGTSFTWSCRNDDAFWQSVDSVCTYQNDQNTVQDPFQRVDASSLEGNWSQVYTGLGTCATPVSGLASWTVSGTATGSVINRYIGPGSVSPGDSQWVSVTVGTPPVSGGFLDIWGRQSVDNKYGIRARLGGDGTAKLSFFNNNVETVAWTGTITIKAGDVLTLQCGVNGPTSGTLTANPRQFQILQNGQPLIMTGGAGILSFLFGGPTYGYTDSGNVSALGPNYRSWGFGMVATGTGSTQSSPGTISQWNAGCDTGFLTLTNIGDQPGWPRYLCYGPGTFLIGDGPGGNYITFGPLGQGQIALLSALPRLPSVIDMSPTQPPQPLTGIQSLISALVNFVTNNNVPPLLQQFESLFGILPPQGPLYSLLNGRFTKPIPPMLQQTGPQTSFIPCSIQGGNNQSKIVAALTPQRRWPE